MNKPATKEPSMDEILSSIRQIIADDDAAAAHPSRPAAPPAVTPPVQAPRSMASAEPLPLSAAQIVSRPTPPAPTPPAFGAPAGQASPMVRPTAAPPAPPSYAALSDDDAEYHVESRPTDLHFEMPQGEPELLDPEDVDFEPESEPMAPPAPPPIMRPAAAQMPAAAPVRQAAPVSRAAPMPDPTLSSDMAEQLLAPTTDAAVKGTMSKLTAAAAIGVGSGQTIEGMMREMMRPMLKAWLDENLPALVERVVEREIARISRGAK